ncbi:MAG: type VII toxin-antitoxin system MntA family adenylyltransferase antitoxin [Nitrospirota bacterium]
MQKDFDKSYPNVGSVLRKAGADPDILAVVLFGSAARGESTLSSDIDVCIVLMPRTYEPAALSHKKMSYAGITDADISVFQQLPLYIKQRVLREGKVLFCRDEDMLYDLAFRTIKEFEDFKHIHREYLSAVEHAR